MMPGALQSKIKMPKPIRDNDRYRMQGRHRKVVGRKTGSEGGSYLSTIFHTAFRASNSYHRQLPNGGMLEALGLHGIND